IRLVQEKHLDAAISTLKKGLESDPDSPVLLNAIGAVYSLKQNTQVAEQYFLKALDFNSGFTPARKNLGILYFDIGEYGLAKAQFEQLSQDSLPDRPVAFLFLGMIAEKNGDYRQAVKLFHKCEGLAFQYPQSILRLAQSLYKLNQRD